MRIDEYKKGGCDIHLTKSEPNQLLQGTVYNLHKFGDHKIAQKGDGEAKNPHRSEVLALDAEGLVKTIEMVGSQGGWFGPIGMNKISV